MNPLPDQSASVLLMEAALRQIAAADDAPTESEYMAAIGAAPGIAKATLARIGCEPASDEEQE